MNAAAKINTSHYALACYQALKAHDARFEGRFFIGVSSTRIYCRLVCRVKLPKSETQFGVTPLQYLQTRRLLTTKLLLTDTDMPTSHVAHQRFL